MSDSVPVVLEPGDVGAWAATPFESLFGLSRETVEEAQLEALAERFGQLRGGIAALDALASRQGVERIERLEDVAPVLFDHRVYKSYPVSLVETPSVRPPDRVAGAADDAGRRVDPDGGRALGRCVARAAGRATG